MENPQTNKEKNAQLIFWINLFCTPSFELSVNIIIVRKKNNIIEASKCLCLHAQKELQSIQFRKNTD